MSSHTSNEDHFAFEDLIEDEGPLAEQVMSEGDIENSIPLVATHLIDELELKNPKMATIIRARFFQGMVLTEVGHIFGVTRERIRQVQEQALSELRASATALGVNPSKFSTFEQWMWCDDLQAR